MTDALLADTLKPEDVAAYLRGHPEFLVAYPELAARLTLPREEGPVASLAVYQLQNLRERNAELEARLTDLMAIAADNERLMQRVHDLNVTMLRANTAAIAARSVITKLGSDFRIDQLRLVLFNDGFGLPPAGWLKIVPQGRAGLPEFAEFLPHHEPLVGRLSPERLQRLFDAYAAELRSAAVMPLGELGLLALGSIDENRFQPGMGTLFLKMIAATVTAALLRSQDLG